MEAKVKNINEVTYRLVAPIADYGVLNWESSIVKITMNIDHKGFGLATMHNIAASLLGDIW